jgi:beta-N-acetylhexosaminidase
MSAHVVFDAIDPKLPATLCRAVLNDLLRRELGYRGVVFSDDLEMKAIADHYGIADGAVAAIDAGCDSVLVCATLEHVLATHAALVARARRDSVFAVRLREASMRTLAARLSRRPSVAAPAEAARLLAAEQPEVLEAQIERALAAR